MFIIGLNTKGIKTLQKDLLYIWFNKAEAGHSSATKKDFCKRAKMAYSPGLVNESHEIHLLDSLPVLVDLFN